MMHAMGNTAIMRIQIDSELKREATEALRRLGLSPSEAVRMFLTQVVAEQAMPFDVDVPDTTTRSAIQELRAQERKGRFNSVTALMVDLNADD